MLTITPRGVSIFSATLPPGSKTTILMCNHCDTPQCTCGGTSVPLVDQEPEHRKYKPTMLKKWDIDPTASMFAVARDFYCAIACHMISDGTHKDERDRIIKPIAENLLNALLLSCAGESRYNAPAVAHSVLWRVRSPEMRKLVFETPFIQYTAALMNGAGMTPGVSPIYESVGTRDQTGHGMVDFVKKYGKARSLRIMRSAFTNFCRVKNTYDVACGGLTWAHGADVGYRYASGQLTDIAFVDEVFDLIHNGGPILNKVYNVQMASPVLMFKRYADPEQVALYATAEMRKAFGLPVTRHVPNDFMTLDAVLVANRGSKLRKAVMRPVPRKKALWCEYVQTANMGNVVYPSGLYKSTMAPTIKSIYGDTKINRLNWHVSGKYQKPQLLDGETINLGTFGVSNSNTTLLNYHSVPMLSLSRIKVQEDAHARLSTTVRGTIQEPAKPQYPTGPITHGSTSVCPLCGPNDSMIF